MADSEPKRISVISATQHPPVGKWNFDSMVPLEGMRGGDPVPVILRGKLSWAHYWESTDDGGKSVSAHGWNSDDPYGEQDSEIEPKFWLRISRQKEKLNRG